MYYTKERCKTAWDEEKKNSFLGDSYDRIDEWGAYWSYLAVKYPDGSNGYQKKIADFLEKEVAGYEKMQVLDIGCGPGTYSLQFAERGAEAVECVDSTAGMLEQLQIRAAQRGLPKKHD